MKPSVRRRLAFVAGLLFVGALPLLADVVSPPRGDRCSSDGLTVDARHAIRIVGADGKTRHFCCLACAERWVDGQGAHPRAVFVTDEASGAEIPAAAAWYVRSRVVSNPYTGDRIHVFARREDAEKHAAAFQGRLLDGPQRPFGPKQ